jgi:hypothetical protein
VERAADAAKSHIMNSLLLAILIPLHFTAPGDTVGVGAAALVYLPAPPVHAYFFQQLDSNGRLTATAGYADSAGSAILAPHAPGTRETVWLTPGADGNPVTIYMMSLDASGNLSAPSNGCVIGELAIPARLATRRAAWTALDVPLVKQRRGRSGQAALAMVLRYYGAAPAALREVEGAYDPVLRSSRISDLAGAARRAGYEAAVVTLTPDSLIHLLGDGVPPIVLYTHGSGPATVGQFGVVTGWDATEASFTLHDGTSRRRVARRDDLVKWWEPAGSQALIVRQRAP